MGNLPLAIDVAVALRRFLLTKASADADADSPDAVADALASTSALPPPIIETNNDCYNL